MPLPELTVGLIVRYEYLWARRAGNADTAGKDHPACVVMTYRIDDRPEDFVIYLPISHTPPRDGEEGIELPDAVKTRAGLDHGRQWILISECNIDTWAQDVRHIPGRSGRYHYGHLPPSFFKKIRDGFIQRYAARKVAAVRRSD